MYAHGIDEGPFKTAIFWAEIDCKPKNMQIAAKIENLFIKTPCGRLGLFVFFGLPKFVVSEFNYSIFYEMVVHF